MDIFSFQEHQMWIPGNRYCRPEFAAKRISGERGREGELDWMTGSICILLQVLVSNTPGLVKWGKWSDLGNWSNWSKWSNFIRSVTVLLQQHFAYSESALIMAVYFY